MSAVRVILNEDQAKMIEQVRSNQSFNLDHRIIDCTEYVRYRVVVRTGVEEETNVVLAEMMVTEAAELTSKLPAILRTVFGLFTFIPRSGGG